MQELNIGDCNFLFGDNPMLVHLHELVAIEYDQKSEALEEKEAELEQRGRLMGATVFFYLQYLVCKFFYRCATFLYMCARFFLIGVQDF